MYIENTSTSDTESSVSGTTFTHRSRSNSQSLMHFQDDSSLNSKSRELIAKDSNDPSTPHMASPPKGNSMRRSMSVPFIIKGILSKPTTTFNKRGLPKKKRHERSKSVHFNEKLPTKLYQLDDRPRVISDENSIDIGRINFDKTIPLGRMSAQKYYEELAEEDGTSSLNVQSNDDYEEQNGFFDYNFPIFNHENGLKTLNVNHFFNRCKDNVYLRDLNVVFDEGSQDWKLNGSVAVQNIFFEKFVILRYTTNSWKRTSDVRCQYMKTTAEFDIFSFNINKLVDLINYNYDKHSITLEFCINYQTTDNSNQTLDFWDNNNDKNYRMRIVIGKAASHIKKETKELSNITQQFKNWNLSFDSPKREHGRSERKSIKKLLNDSDSDSDMDIDALDFNFEDKFMFGGNKNLPDITTIKKNSNSSENRNIRKPMADNFNSNDILQSAMNQYPFRQYNFKNSFNS